MPEISDEMYEELRKYLEEWNERPYTLKEAKEVGDGFIDFFSLLIELNNIDEEPRDKGEVAPPIDAP